MFTLPLHMARTHATVHAITHKLAPSLTPPPLTHIHTNQVPGEEVEIVTPHTQEVMDYSLPDRDNKLFRLEFLSI